MPSSNHRSSSSSAVAHSHTSRRKQAETASIPTSRSSSVPGRQFIIILTNNPDMIRRTTNFRPQTRNQQATPTAVPIQVSSNQQRTLTNTNNNNSNNNSNTYQNHREQILNSLLRVELSEAIRSYLSQTHRSCPIHYVFDMSNVEASTSTTTPQQNL